MRIGELTYSRLLCSMLIIDFKTTLRELLEKPLTSKNLLDVANKQEDGKFL